MFKFKYSNSETDKHVNFSLELDWYEWLRMFVVVAVSMTIRHYWWGPNVEGTPWKEILCLICTVAAVTIALRLTEDFAKWVVKKCSKKD